MEWWKVTKARDYSNREPDRHDYTRTFFLKRGTEEVQTSIEFTDSRVTPDANAAGRILKPYLELEDVPPRRLLVNLDARSETVLEA